MPDENKEFIDVIDDLIEYSAYFIYNNKSDYDSHIKNLKKLKKHIQKENEEKYLERN